MHKSVHLKLFSLFFLLLFSSSAWSMFGSDRIPVQYDKSTMRLLGKMQSVKMLDTEIKDLEDKIARGPADIAELQDYLGVLRKKRNSLLSPGTIGTLIARGLAGSSWEFLDDVPVDGVGEGVVKGVAIRASRALGDVVGERITGALEATVGTTADVIIAYFVDTCEYAYRFLFHSSQEPFSTDKIALWQNQIREIFEDIEKLMKDGLKDSLRGHDMTLRQFDLDEKTGKPLLDDQKGASEHDKDVEREEDLSTLEFMQRSAGADLVHWYVAQFERLIEDFDKCAGYYDKNSYEVFCAQQIKDRLLKFGTILLKTTSLKDLDSALDSNKAIIPAFRKCIDNLFKRLIDTLRPRSYIGTKGNTIGWDQKVRNKKYRHTDTEDEEDFPESFSK
jgi:hypothetical protein